MDAGLIFLIIFLLVIAILIGVAVFGSAKDKKKKKSELEERKFIRDVSDVSYKKIILLIDLTITHVAKDAANFVPSIGTKTLGQINSYAKNVINSITSSKELKDTYKVPERKLEIQSILNELSSLRPSAWSREAFFSVSVIKGKAEGIRKLPENKEIVKMVESKFKWN